MYKYRLLTPGPVAVPERVRRAMAQELIHHRAPPFRDVFDEIRDGLRGVFQTQEPVLVLASSGTGAMEAAVANLLAPGERAVVVEGGKFGERWAEICEAFGVEPIRVAVEWGQAVSPAAVRAAFERAPDARALLVQASETSTGVYHPIRELAAVAHEQPERLIVVDGISAVGVHDLPMDDWGLDVVVSGSQKSWMLPPGLAFVALAPRAREALGRAGSGYYFDLRRELEAQEHGQTAYTPAVSLLLGLREVLVMIRAEGLQARFERHARLAEIVRAAVRSLGLELFAPKAPSFACTAIRVPEGLDGQALVLRMRERYGVHVAGGQGRVTGRILRIGHMGDVDAFDMLTAVAALELALSDLGFPVKLGEGMRAASEIMREPAAKRS
ncbi:MAG: pyridoxal-phosphate-dependent aminotransferase family protein [Myxococcota bacterium]